MDSVFGIDAAADVDGCCTTMLPRGDVDLTAFLPLK